MSCGFVIPKGAYRLAFVPRDTAATNSEPPVERPTAERPAAEPPTVESPLRRSAVACRGITGSCLRHPASALPCQKWLGLGGRRQRTPRRFGGTQRASVAPGRTRSGWSRGRREIARSPLWTGIADSDRPLMIMLGDLFMYTQVDPASGHTQLVRDTTINSSEELRAFLASNPAIAPGRGALYMSLIQKSAAIGMASVLQLVSHPGRRVEVRAREEVKNDDLSDHDIIYIGPVARLGPLEGFYQQRSRYRLEPGTAGMRDLVTQKVLAPGGRHQRAAQGIRTRGTFHRTGRQPHRDHHTGARGIPAC